MSIVHLVMSSAGCHAAAEISTMRLVKCNCTGAPKAQADGCQTGSVWIQVLSKLHG